MKEVDKSLQMLRKKVEEQKKAEHEIEVLREHILEAILKLSEKSAEFPFTNQGCDKSCFIGKWPPHPKPKFFIFLQETGTFVCGKVFGGYYQLFYRQYDYNKLSPDFYASLALDDPDYLGYRIPEMAEEFGLEFLEFSTVQEVLDFYASEPWEEN